jgi:hypothetical protein
MGSYLSIVNDTKDPWQCKIGPDQAALKIAGIVISVVGGIATAIGTAGAAAPVAASLVANGVVGVFGVSTTALATATAGAAAAATYASVVGGVSGFGMTVAKAVTDRLGKDGYVMIAPGQNQRWGKMTLSLWQQGTCVKSVLVNEKTVRLETLYMRPIFSGATKDSNNDHKIQWWINKWGTEKQEVVAQNGKRLLQVEETGEAVPGNAAISGVADADAVTLPPTDEMFELYPNGTNTYTN